MKGVLRNKQASQEIPLVKRGDLLKASRGRWCDYNRQKGTSPA